MSHQRLITESQNNTITATNGINSKIREKKKGTGERNAEVEGFTSGPRRRKCCRE